MVRTFTSFTHANTYLNDAIHNYLINRYGSPYIELTDTSYIIGGGSISTIEYKGKGYFTGKSHTFKATLTALPGQGGAANEYIVEGLWHEKSKFTKGPSTGDFYDVATSSKEEATVVGGEKDGSQGEFETRKLWNLVAKGIREGDYELASREKSKIENDQRQRRKDEATAGTKWELKHFKHEDSDPICEWPGCCAFFERFVLADGDSLDERLGRLAKLNPSEENFYEFAGNWPDSLSN